MATQTIVSNNHGEATWSGGGSPMNVSYGKLMMWYFLLSDAFTFAGFLIAYGTLRFSNPSWPVPDKVFQSFPGLAEHGWPLVFVTVMSFVLIVSSVTMVRAVQEGHQENKNGVLKWMILTILGGAAFLGCQALEWKTLLTEGMTITKNPFGTHDKAGAYVLADGSFEEFKAGTDYQLLTNDHLEHALHSTDPKSQFIRDNHSKYKYGTTLVANTAIPTEYKGRQLVFKGEDGKLDKATVMTESFGPKSFGALFFCITGFHGFHVLSGLIILTIVCINVASGLYEKRKNGYEMVEKVGLYWHFVDLVWVFVFLAFYLL